MHSQLQTDTIEQDKVQVLKYKTVKSTSGLCKAPKLSNKKVASPGENKTERLKDKGQLSKTAYSDEQSGSNKHDSVAGKVGVGNSPPAMLSGNRHKPWPSREVDMEEEVVKYMSRVPSYLQPQEKGDNFQDKALSVGVLDWGRLEKWTYLQKQSANRKTEDSPSSSSSSPSPFSTSGSSSHSDRSINSPCAQRKLSPTLAAHQNSSSKGQLTRMWDQQSSVPVITSPDLRTSDNKKSFGHNHVKGKVNGSAEKRISHDESAAPEISISFCPSKDNDSSAFSQEKVKAQIDRSEEAENSRCCEQQCVQDNLELAEDDLSYRFSVVESTRDHPQESCPERHTSFDSTIGNEGNVNVNRSSFSETFLHSDNQATNPPPRISYSCPLFSTSQDEPYVVTGPLSGNEMPTANTKSKLLMLARCTDISSAKVVDMADKSSQAEVKVAAAPRRDLSPHRLLRAGLNRIRSSNLREGSPGKLIKQTGSSDNPHNDPATNKKGRRSSSPQRLLSAGLNLLRNSSTREGSTGQNLKETVCSENFHEDNAAANVRSRRSSPLRRIFDPLMSKNQIPFSGPVTSLASHRAQGISNRDKIPIREELKSANGSYRSPEVIVNNSTSQVSEAECSVRAEEKVTSTRQAFLKLAWKNGLPLFVFSSSDINILAASIEKSETSQNNSECMYTIFTAHEVKKKSGVWTSQVNRSKNHDLVYNVVGQLKVCRSKSTTYDSKNYLLVREFVLYGGEKESTAQDRLCPQFRNELAAIIINDERLENGNCGIVQSSSCRESSQVVLVKDEHSKESSQFNQRIGNSRLTSVVAILPSGVHGISSTGEPSPLIKRWKSGGSCDCGGWDEGCMLTILTDKIKERRPNSEQICTTVGTNIELVTQGETKETRHAFSMITFKEGVYTVDFGASISSLQAFALCIATLHSRKATTLPKPHCSEDAQIPAQQTIFQGGSSSSYLPEHPPLSPFGRA